VPAVLAYNFFTRRLKLASGDLDDFAADLINLSRKVSFRNSNKPDVASSVVNIKKEAFA